MLLVMTVFPLSGLVSVLERLVVEVNENKSQTENDTPFPSSFFSCLCASLEMSRSLCCLSRWAAGTVTVSPLCAYPLIPIGTYWWLLLQSSLGPVQGLRKWFGALSYYAH